MDRLLDGMEALNLHGEATRRGGDAGSMKGGGWRRSRQEIRGEGDDAGLDGDEEMVLDRRP